MTQWVETPAGGRARGPGGLARAWVEVLVRPRRFFRNGVAPGDQASGLSFAVIVTLVYVGTQYLFRPDAAPVVGGRPWLSAALALAVAGLVVAPVVLHLVAALLTLTLVPTVPDRAGVSETVQVLAYATAPCALAGLPFDVLRVACCLYGAGLLAVGIGVVHETDLLRAGIATALPALVVFGYAFGGVSAAETVLGVELVSATSAVVGPVRRGGEGSASEQGATGVTLRYRPLIRPVDHVGLVLQSFPPSPLPPPDETLRPP